MTTVLRGIQPLRGQNFAIVWPPPTCVDSFYTLSVDKNRHFLTPSSCPRSYWLAPKWSENAFLIEEDNDIANKAQFKVF